MSTYFATLGGLFSSDGFVPRRVCGLWPEWLVWEHVVGNALVWLAYVAMPLMLWRLGIRWPNWTSFRGLLRAFALFIALCGLGHFLDMLAFFHPLYRFSGHVLVATGLVSCWTMWSIRREWPALMAMKRPDDLERVIAERTAELTRALNDVERVEVDRVYLATIVESSHDAIVSKDLDGVITSWNGAAERIFGYSAVEAVGRPKTFLFPPDRLDEEQAILERLRRGETVDHFESVRLTKDGRSIDVSLTISPIKERSGRIVGISKIVRDISERKRADDLVRRTEEEFRQFAESIPQLTWMARADGHIFWYNRRWYEYTGTSPEQMDGWGWQSVHDPDVLPRVLVRWRESIASGEPFEMVFPIRSATGEFRRFLSRVMPSHDSEGRVLRWVGTNTDIEDQTRAEERLKASERLYRAIGESIPYGVWTCDPEGRCTYASESFLQLVGLSQEQCSEFGWANVMHPEDAERTVAAWKACVRTEGIWDHEPRFRGLDGGWHPILARGLPVRDDDGRIVCWAGINLDISRLKRAEEALRRSEERQRLALTAARISHWEWDIPGDRISYQDSLSLLYDRPDDQPFADLSDYLSVVHPDDRDALRGAAERALTPGVPYEIDYRIVWSDGSVRWLAGRGGTFFSEDGAPLRMVGINLDITERKEAEAQIRLLNEGLEERIRERTAEARQQARLIDQARDAILVRSESGKISYWNEGAERLYGWKRDEAMGCAIHDLLRTQFPQPLAEIEDELARIGSWDGELIHTRRDGGQIVVASRWVIDRDRADDGAILEINSDITERRASEEALRQSEAALKESQRLARVGSWQWDVVADVVTWSDELYRIAGRDPSVLAPNYRERAILFTPESLERHDRVIAAALETGRSYEVELEMITAAGENRWIIGRGEAVRGPDGRVQILRGTAQDVTAHKREEEELRRARDDATAAVRAKGEFLANMSHEIRTPMNGVIGMTELLLDTRLDDVQRGYAETIQSSGEALLKVIDDILDFSKIEAGRLTIQSTDFDLRALMEEVADLLSPLALQKKLKIAYRVDPDLPGRLVGDPVRIRQVLTNLAGNAIKFTEHGAVDLEAQLLAEEVDASMIRILVRDTGIGIPADRQSDVFESFTQIDGGNSRRFGGTGLGLAICRSLVTLMGGQIGLESRPGAGSTFWFDLSLSKVEGEGDTPAGQLAGLRVLVIDGHETDRATLRDTLLSWECRPEVVGSGAEALGKLLANPDDDPFGVILLDQDVPGMNAEQTARAINAAPRFATVPLVLLASPGLSGEVDGEVADGPWAARTTKLVSRSQLYTILCQAVADPKLLCVTPPAVAESSRLPIHLRILLAEDVEVNRLVAIGLVARLGCETDAVCNGQEAVAALDYDLHDLVLMDVQMPGMDGFAATAVIRERERGTGRHIPIIAMTAHSMQGDKERCLAAGMDGYISKPIHPASLREALAAWGVK